MEPSLTTINLVVVCDGTSDLCLQSIIEWIADTAYPDQGFRIVAAKEVIPAHGNLSARLCWTHQHYSSDIIICHRDAENMPMGDRIAEIAAAAAELPVQVVPAVPVRMIESWLLTDLNAIRCAANNRNGQSPVPLPRINRIEQLQDSKEALYAALKAASNLPPRRLRRFNEARARSRVTSFMNDFAQLRALESFRVFEARLVAAIAVRQ